jgi:bla regulator protein blaR1
MHRTPGRLTAIASVKGLISIASGMPEIRIVGGPDWAGTQRYNIIATTPASPDQTFISKEDKRRILGLLAERFKLITHIEKREGPMYALVVAKGGVKLSPPTTDSRGGLTGGTGRIEGHLTGMNVALSMLEDFLTQELGRPVQDQTGLKGRYDFKLNWSRSDDVSAPSEYPSIFVALPEQLGLALISKKAPIDFMVIDHVERPSEN